MTLTLVTDDRISYLLIRTLNLIGQLQLVRVRNFSFQISLLRENPRRPNGWVCEYHSYGGNQSSNLCRHPYQLRRQALQKIAVLSANHADAEANLARFSPPQFQSHANGTGMKASGNIARTPMVRVVAAAAQCSLN